MAATVTSFSLIILCGILVAIMVMAGVLVASDAKKRGMNSLGWGLVAAFGPFLIGVIIYLVSRQPIVDYNCSNCGEDVDKDANICPHCGSKFGTKCAKCGFTLNPSWSSCPNCGEGIEEKAAKVVPAIKKSKSNGFIIVLSVIISVVLFGIVFVLPKFSILMSNEYTYSGTGFTGNIGMGNITKEDLSVNEDIAKWINDCSEAKEDVCVLISKSTGDGIIYLKGMDELCELSGDFEYRSDGKLDIVLTPITYGVKNEYGFDFYAFKGDLDYDINIKANLPDEFDADVNVTYTDADISMNTWNR